MQRIPVSAGWAEYRSIRYRILFSTADWVALDVGVDIDIPDEMGRGQRWQSETGAEQWVKVPRSALTGVTYQDVNAKLHGEPVWVREQRLDGRVRVEFTGEPEAAKRIGLEGDQHLGWAGWVEPTYLTDVQVEETRLA